MSDIDKLTVLVNNLDNKVSNIEANLLNVQKNLENNINSILVTIHGSGVGGGDTGGGDTGGGDTGGGEVDTPYGGQSLIMRYTPAHPINSGDIERFNIPNNMKNIPLDFVVRIKYDELLQFEQEV